MTKFQKPLDVLKHHVTGAIERGEAQPVVGMPLLVFPHFPARALAERDIITRAIYGLLNAGFSLSLDDGEAGFNPPDPILDAQAIANEMWTMDEDWLYAWNDAGQCAGWVRLIYGNDGPDVISDYSTTLEAALKDANARAAELLG